MIVPVIDEAIWSRVLHSLPIWHPPAASTLVISPHPDDETLAAGGLIASLTAAGVAVSVAAVTDGENAYKDEVGLGPIREKEQTAALYQLGVAARDIHRLRMKDSGLHDLESELTEKLRPLVRPGMHIVAPWTGDFHPDHEVCGRAASAIANSVGATVTLYFFWTWHRGVPATLDGLPLVSFPLTQQQVATKQCALQCHRSQLQHPSGQPILPEYLLDPMKRPFEVYLPV